MDKWKLESFGLVGISALLLLTSVLFVREYRMGQLDLFAGALFGALLLVSLASYVILILMRKASHARDQAVLNLTNSQRRYQRLVETAHAGIWILDNDGRCVFANRS